MPTEIPAISLAEIEARIAGDLEEIRRRGRRRIVVVGVLAFVVLGYLSWAMARVESVGPEAVAEIAGGYIRVNLPAFEDALRQSLVNSAPEVVERLRVALINSPKTLRRQAEAALPYGTELLARRFRNELDAYLDAAVQGMVEATPDRDPEKLVENARAGFHGMINTILEDMHDQYAAQVAEVVRELRRLAAGKNLSKRDRVKREIIEATLALVERERALNDLPPLFP